MYGEAVHSLNLKNNLWSLTKNADFDKEPHYEKKLVKISNAEK